MDRIIVPLDGSALAERAIPFADALARALNGRIELIHALCSEESENSAVAERSEKITGYLLAMSERLTSDHPAQIRTLQADVVDALVECSREQPGTLIVMATHGRTGLGRLMLGSTADKVMRRAMAPVVLVREPVGWPEDAPRHLLVPLDGSQRAELALPFATRLARRPGATLTLVRVVTFGSEGSPLGAIVGLPPFVESASDEVEDARAYLYSISQRLRAEGIRVAWEVRSGRPGDEIVRAAQTTATDLVVMATHGRGGVRRWALGSVTEHVLHHGSLPVVVVPSRIAVHDRTEHPAEAAPSAPTVRVTQMTESSTTERTVGKPAPTPG